ncbi:MAG: HzsA-related protein [Pirellulales bacterium]
MTFTTSKRPNLVACFAAVSALVPAGLVGAAEGDGPIWPQAMLSARAALQQSALEGDARLARQTELVAPIQRRFPLQYDWLLQHLGPEPSAWFDQQGEAEIERRLIRRALDELGPAATDLAGQLDRLDRADAPADDRRWLDLYVQACRQRRARRLAPLAARWRSIVFTKHYDLGGSHYAYTEGQSDAQDERHFRPGSALCLLTLDESQARVRTLLEDSAGVIRDPDVSYDGRRILFAWKKSDREDDYHLYEMQVESGRVRQLTFGLGFADYEGVYLPGGDILFHSTRCVQTVDCWWTEVSNLYTCDADGRYLRRLGFDQVHTSFPTVTADGRILYTRWDYNDRGQIFPQGLFQMNPDGTAQGEFYGNNSWFPTTILHAREIPGTNKVAAIFTGHHTIQKGWPGLVDPSRGRQEAQGAQLIAPVRPTLPERIDAYGQWGDQFQYPYPLSETEFLVALQPESANPPVEHFGLYLVTADGRRELLAYDPAISSNQPIPLAPRPEPPARASRVDYRKKTGTYYIQDIYAGPGLEGVPRGAIKRLRVVALEFRAAGIGHNGNHGPAGGALASTPISIGNGSWDPKIVLGETPVYEDGSAGFQVPARTPVYFQAIDARGRAVQTMRSWSTLQPGEVSSCVGCHESRSAAPVSNGKPSLALAAGARPLEPFYGPARGFSFTKEIQPLLDRQCVSCHKEYTSEEVLDPVAKRRWSRSYLTLTQARPNPEGYYLGESGEWVNWINIQAGPSMLPPYEAGAAKSRLVTLLDEEHEGVTLSREDRDKIACWIDLLVPFCGDYVEANAWSPEELDKYNHFLAKRTRMEAIERKNVEEYVKSKE